MSDILHDNFRRALRNLQISEFEATYNPRKGKWNITKASMKLNTDNHPTTPTTEKPPQTKKDELEEELKQAFG